jgi:Acetyltransferase (GNAT) domain
MANEIVATCCIACSLPDATLLRTFWLTYTAATAPCQRRPTVTIVPFVAPLLDDRQLGRWREFNAGAPAAQYSQDPSWAEVERRGSRAQSRHPYFFWCERDGAICLTALGIRRRLPVPGRVFWEFKHGPTVLEPAVLDEWLPWLVKTLRSETARLRLQPVAPLDDIGDEMETILDAHGFVRRRSEGIWSTLVVDLNRPEDEILASFRSRYRSRIRQSTGLGIEIAEQDDLTGWNTLAALDAEMSARTGMQPVDAALVQAIGRCWCDHGHRGTVLVARLGGGESLAAVLVVAYRSTAHMVMMPSSRRHEKLPTSHRLLWEAMLWAKAHGFTEFDLDGYALAARPADALWGINQFKRGFAPKLEPRKYVAVHERVFSAVIVSSAAAMRRLQARRRLKTQPEHPS